MTPIAPQMGAGPRALLRRLREAMAQPVSAQERLDKTVELIASNLVAEVCSIYIRRAGDQLELFATKGLLLQCTMPGEHGAIRSALNPRRRFSPRESADRDTCPS